MQNLIMLSLSLILVVPVQPAQAAEDVSFLKDLGGVVTQACPGRTKIAFKDGTEVILTGASMSTSNANGFVFMTDSSLRCMAVKVPGHGVISYAPAVDVAGLNPPGKQ